MAKLTAQKIFEIEQEVNKLDTSRFSVVSEVQLIDRALEMHKAAKKFEAQEEIDMAYKCYFLFVSMATYIFKKTKDELYVKEMLTKPTVESMNKLEKMKDDSIKLEKNKDNIKNEEKENRKSPVKSSQSKDLGVKTKKSSASGADIKSNAKNGVHEAGINSMDKYIIKPEDKYEPATPSISSSELHKILNNRNVLLIDCRPQQEYNSCTLKTSAENLINVPEEINVKGLSAKTLGDKLMAEHQTLWSIRNTFDHIILFDQYSKVKPNGKDSSLERLLLIINEYDVNTKYKTAPVLLEGGFNAWFCHFPFLTTNSANYKQSLHDMGYKLPSQTNINDITYHLDSTSPEPDLPGDDEGSTPVPAPTTTPQPVPETKNINPADTPLVRPKPPPQVDRSNKPFENSNPVPPSQRKPSRTSEQDNQPVKRPDRLLSNGKVADSRVERPRFDGGESLRPFGSKLTRSSSHPNLSQMNGGDTLHEGRTSSNIPEFDRSKKPIQDRLHHYDRRDSSVAGTNVGPGLTGLKNLGNTCYINSILQCLSNTSPLREYFVTEFKRSMTAAYSKTSGKLAEEFQLIFNMLWAGDSRYFSPQKFKEEVGKMKRTFRGYEQQDSHEFLTILIDTLHEDLKEPEHKNSLTGASIESGEKSWGEFRKKNKSIISELFYGQLKSTVICCNCQETSSTFEVFSNVSLPLPSNDYCSLRDCLDLYLKDEEIQGWHCPRCKTKQDARKKLDITRLPPILVLHFKRFTSDGWCRKKQTTVDFPVDNLNMSEYTVNSESRDVRYDLYAVSNHYGTMESGHYTAYCRNNYKWYKFDDSDVSEISASKVKSPAAYILFYMSCRK